MSGDFDAIYSNTGRTSIAPEKLLRALLLQAFFSVCFERQLMQQITYNRLFRWLIGLAMGAPVWDVTMFTKNRVRMLEGNVARAFLPRSGRSPAQAAAVERAILHRRHADHGVGVDEELPAEGRQRRACGTGPQLRARLPRREEEQRDARVDDGP